MKKFIFIAVLAASGLVSVSCSTDAEEMENVTSKQKEVFLKQENAMSESVGDSIATGDLQTAAEGPGDGPIVPPLPPKP